jgi:hypothetical protein
MEEKCIVMDVGELRVSLDDVGQLRAVNLG